MTRTLTAPGIEVNEVDKSDYAPIMTGTNCFVMGFTAKGEPYTPMEFTSRNAWISYYGIPTTEAERYSYAAACEVLDQHGKLIFARLPYDNESYSKAVGFKYELGTTYSDIENSKFKEIKAADASISTIATIKATSSVLSSDLSTIESYKTDEKKVPNNSFIIYDKTFGTYSRIQEDSRKNVDCELIGILPVITTAANAMYVQNLINVEKQNVKNYETVGTIKNLLSNEVLSGDTCKLLNSDNYYTLIDKLNIRIQESVDISCDETNAVSAISSHIVDPSRTDGIGILSSWDGTYQISAVNDPDDENTPVKYALFSYQRSFLSTQLPEDLKDEYIGQYGYHNIEGSDEVPDTLAQEANTFFPTIDFEDDKFDRTNLRKIGVVVYKMYLDSSEGNKINYEPVEAFAGSLCRDDADPNTGTTTFIDKVVNTNSEYICLFSNCFNTAAGKKLYQDLDLLVVDRDANCITPSLGFTSPMTSKKISVAKSIYDGMNTSMNRVANVDRFQIDVVPDAGLANIASYIAAIFGDAAGEYDLAITDEVGNSLLGLWKTNATNTATKTWKAVEQRLDNFCRKIRKDCMFIADGPRPLSLAGQKKVVRDSKPDSSIDKDILPYVKLFSGLNTSYGAGYLGWFEQADDYSGELFWCPPSVKAMGIYINTDVNYNYWDAPAGLNRGIVSATDVSFSPTQAQAGSIYEKNWNYAIDYPNDGIALEGQKTFQVKKSAFDRVNIRRLFLRLERQTYLAARYFNYEGNTAYTRQRFIDAIEPLYKNAKANSGIYDYKLICDESNNTDDMIDNNEMHAKVGIKPVKSIEWIIIDFIANRTGGSWEEVGM